MPKRYRFLKKALIAITILIVLGLIAAYLQNIFETPQEAARIIRSMGYLGPVAIITLIVLEVVLAPLPGLFFSLTSGFAFGTVLGSIYSYIGNVIGASAAFLIADRIGRPIVERMIKKKELDMYDCIFHEYGKRFLWIVYLIPMLPIDVISYAVGLSRMRYRKFLPIIAIALIPYNIIVAYFGSTLYMLETSSFLLVLIIIVIVVAIGVTIYSYVLKKQADKINDCN